MYAVLLAAAVEPKIPDALGPFPILQFFGGLLTLIIFAVGMLVWRRGEQHSQEARAKSANGGGVQVFMDGPLVEGLRSLKGIEEALKGIHREAVDSAKLVVAIREDLIRRIDDNRHTGRNELHKEVQETERRLEAMQNGLSSVQQQVAHIEGWRANLRVPSR